MKFDLTRKKLLIIKKVMDRIDVYKYTEIYKDYYNTEEIYQQTQEIENFESEEVNELEMSQENQMIEQETSGNEIVEVYKGSYINVTV